MDYTTVLQNTWQGYRQNKIATSVKENFKEEKTHKKEITYTCIPHTRDKA